MTADEGPIRRWLRPPAHTGGNRCWPCTAVNVVLAGAVGLIAALLASPVVGAAALVVGLGLTALRGYLVPGTPALTERYLPERVRLALGADHPAAEGADAGEFETLERVAHEREHRVDADAFLVDAGVCEQRDGAVTADPTLTGEFRAAQDGALAERREGGVDPAAVARVFDVDAAAVIRRDDADQPTFVVDSRVRTWPSTAALLHDVATDATLRDWTDNWAAVPRRQRVSLLETLRKGRERCPACDGSLERTADRVPSCCGEFRVRATVCLDCGDHLLEEDRTAGTSKLV